MKHFILEFNKSNNFPGRFSNDWYRTYIMNGASIDKWDGDIGTNSDIVTDGNDWDASKQFMSWSCREWDER